MKINMNNLWLHLIIYMVIHVGIQDLVDAKSEKHRAPRTTPAGSDEERKYDGTSHLNNGTRLYDEQGKDVNEYRQSKDEREQIIGEFIGTQRHKDGSKTVALQSKNKSLTGKREVKMIITKDSDETEEDDSDANDYDYSSVGTEEEESQDDEDKGKNKVEKKGEKEETNKSDAYEDYDSDAEVSDSSYDKGPVASYEGEDRDVSDEVSTKRRDDNPNAETTKGKPGSLGSYFVYVNCSECHIRSKLLVKGQKPHLERDGNSDADGSDDNDTDESVENETEERVDNEVYSEKSDDDGADDDDDGDDDVSGENDDNEEYSDEAKEEDYGSDEETTESDSTTDACREKKKKKCKKTEHYT